MTDKAVEVELVNMTDDVMLAEYTWADATTIVPTDLENLRLPSCKMQNADGTLIKSMLCNWR